jgi:hypothetical protein
VILWSARAALGVAIVATIALRPPDAASLLVAFAYGAQIVHAGHVPTYVGNEVFSSAHAWDGGLGWLGAVLTWLAGRADSPATAFATCALALTAFLLVAARARRRAPARYALAAAALAALCAGDALREGGGIESAAFAAALYLVLERPGPRSAVLATLLAVLWCNVSPQGILAPALAGIAALSAQLERHPASDRRWAWIALAGTAGATLATPAGWSFAGLAVEALRIDRGLEGLVPYHPADVSAFAYRAGFTLAMLLGLTFGAGRLRAGDALLWIAATLLALANGAYLAVFGVLVAPLLAASAAELLTSAKTAGTRTSAEPADTRTSPETAGTRTSAETAGAGGRSRNLMRGALVPAVAVLALSLAGTAASRLRPAVPVEAAVLAQRLAADGRPHRLFCATIDWCSVAEAAGAPLVSGYMDGRVEVYPDVVRAEQLAIARLKATWRGQLESERVDAVLVRRDRSFSTLLAGRPGWRLADQTDSLALYVRRP